jgi:hypothetical protein
VQKWPKNVKNALEAVFKVWLRSKKGQKQAKMLASTFGGGRNNGASR